MDPVAAFRQQPHGEHGGHGFTRSRFAHHADDLTLLISSETWFSAWTSPRKIGSSVQVFNA
jgi:hypothetical protein